MHEDNDALEMYVIRGNTINQVLMLICGEELEYAFSEDYPSFVARGDLLILDNADLAWSDDVQTTTNRQA